MNILRSKYYGIIRGITVALALFLQAATMILLSLYLLKYFLISYLLLEVVSILIVFTLVYNEESYKSFWIIIILILPVSGLFLYFVWGRRRHNSKSFKEVRKIEKEITEDYLKPNYQVVNEIYHKHPNKVQICRYLDREGFPIYQNTQVKYYPLGEDLFEDMLKDIEQAHKFIFMEYFIVSDGIIWKKVLNLLTKKVEQGVEVRLLFDDFGTLILNTDDFRQDMKKRGIKLATFGPIHKDVGSLSFNYRNHQKITVIDGNIGYTGGINIADEYANLIERFGHWKDSGIRIYGEGVFSFTCFFMEMWKVSVTEDEFINCDVYRPIAAIPEKGFVQPFMGGPHRNPLNPTEGAYTRMINKARDYIYITTPYLVLDRSMLEDLTSAARSGVDVRIICPHIYDKWYVYMVNVSNYGKLMGSGVRVYEYIPGFIHAKNIIVDDECAICGTINTDYRSFYHHYECGVFFSEVDAIQDMKQDFINTLEQCQEMNLDEWNNRSYFQKLIQDTLKIMSPVL